MRRFATYGFEMPCAGRIGIYILQIVPDAATARTAEHFLVSTRFKVLTLSLPDNKMEVVTVDSRSGQPISGAKVSFYSAYNEENRKLVKTLSPIPVEKRL